MKICEDLYSVSVDDHRIDLFEGQYRVPNGMAYNSYVLIDEKIAVWDTVDGHFTDQWLQNLSLVLAGRKPDYLILSHMEPDHSAGIAAFCQKYPQAVLIGNSKTFPMLEAFFPEFSGKSRQIVADRETLNLGRHTLTFLTAPMVHWPEVMVTFDSLTGTLFSADAFGKFGASDVKEDWACEARRYYFGIVGKYGAQVQALLKKLADFPIKTICPLHGPVLSESLPYYLGLYQTWSSYGVESDGVCIAYTSVYGHTADAANRLADALREAGCPKVVLNDLARCDMAEAVEDAFRYGKLVLATTTYNGDIFPMMKQFLDALTERNFRNRTVGFIENGSWAPMAARNMKAKLEKCPNLTYPDSTVTIRSALNDESRAALNALARELA